jgi:putative DNA primase/helicase
MTWEQFTEWMSNPYRVNATREEYTQLTRQQQADLKNTRSYVGGYLEGGLRRKGSVKNRCLLVLDADTAEEDLWEAYCLEVGSAALLYSTLSYTPERPKFRLCIPLARDITPEEYTPLARILAERLGMKQFDRTTDQPERLMYQSSVLKDAPFVFETLDTPLLDPDEWLGALPDWRDASCWALWPGEPEAVKAQTKKLGDPREKDGIVGAFCRAYSIGEAIDAFLPEIYTPDGKGRYTYTKGSTAKGLVVYDDLYAYSNHGTDPAATGHAANAFDLVRLQKYSDLDKEAKPDTPVNKLPSFLTMAAFASEDAAVRKIIVAEEFPEEEEAKEIQWLSFSRTGGIKINRALLAAAMRQETDLFVGKDHAFYYDPDQGIWKRGADDYLETEVLKKLGKHAEMKIVSDVVRQTIGGSRDMNKDIPTADKQRVVLNGGTYDLHKGQYTDGYDKELYALVKYPIRYDKNATAAKFEGYVADVFGEDTIPFIYEWIGFCFYPEYEPQKILFIQGEGGSGKSTFIQIIKSIIGNEAASNISLKALKDNNFAASGLFGKTANFDSDAKREYLGDADFLKSLTGDWIRADIKNKQPIDFRNCAKLTFAMNHMPTVRDTSGGFERRAIILKANGTISEKTRRKYPLKQILAERSGIFNGAMEGLRRLLATGEFSVTDRMTAEVKELMRDNDNVMRFIEDIKDEMEGWISAAVLYEKYREFCYEAGETQSIVVSRTFGKRLSQMGLESDRRRVEGKVTRGWFVPEKEPEDLPF